MYVNFCGDVWEILGRMSEARDEVLEEADAVCSVRMVLLCAMHELWIRVVWLAAVLEAAAVRDVLEQRRARGG